MDDVSPTSSTADGLDDVGSLVFNDPTPLKLDHLPPVAIIPHDLADEELRELEDVLFRSGAPLCFKGEQAKLFLAQVVKPGRARFELRRHAGVWTEPSNSAAPEKASAGDESEPQSKRRKLDAEAKGSNGDEVIVDSDAASDDHHGYQQIREIQSKATANLDFGSMHEKSVVVIKIAWLKESIIANKVLDFNKYVIYQGRRVPRPASSESNEIFRSPAERELINDDKRQLAENILERARAENEHIETSQVPPLARFRGRRPGSPSRRSHVPLLHRSTTDEEAANHVLETRVQPEWVTSGSTFSCERVTLMHPPNEAFVEQLKIIRTARKLTNDEIGVRAYSTSIAAISAYPYPLTSRLEVLALPGCDAKIAALWTEWHENEGKLSAVRAFENDAQMEVLRLFYDIWGVGAHTARDYYNRGWRDLDDVVEYGWETLPRAVQIGVKYYDDFKLRIPRSECEAIEAVIGQHLRRLRDPKGAYTCLVGGYRRGKETSGDVDVIVSHTEERATLNLVEDLVASLMADGWVTHELITHASSSRREQVPSHVRDAGGGHGFDALDKAFCVWHDPHADAPAANPHRRVDIIAASWSRIGCALLGWSADTTFERDLRRFAKYRKNWKFDSSGVRERATGREVDVQGECESAEQAERNVFKAFGLEWRDPWERCTG